ncbi:MAG: formylglycine-generating enzyme family protein, partial [Armatimonadetes bacterium]|nr:formylglycine-generating enzyme family protein [Armatimonadota bacterium]
GPPPSRVGNFADETLKRKYKGLKIITGYDDGYAETSPVGAFPAGASPYGCLDMAGNVLDWCADWYAEDYYGKSQNRNPTGPASGQHRVLRGGSWNNYYSSYLRAADRGGSSPDYRFYDFGFRCSAGRD